MSEPTSSRYLNETDELIVRAAQQILKRGAIEWLDRVMDANVGTSEIMNIARMQDRMDVAADAISNALVAVHVNAAHYPADAPEPQSLRVPQ